MKVYQWYQVASAYIASFCCAADFIFKCDAVDVVLAQKSAVYIAYKVGKQNFDYFIRIYYCVM